MSTVTLPIGNGLTVGWCPDGGSEQVWVSPITAAGIPPMSTVAAPGPVITPPWVLTSPTLAAGGMVS
jgi:hypothetical protein